MIAESAAMSKPRMKQVGIGRGGWPAGNASAPDVAPQWLPADTLARNFAQQAGNCGDDDKSREKPGECAEAMILERLSAA